MRWGGFILIIGCLALAAFSGLFAVSPETQVASLGVQPSSYLRDRVFIEQQIASVQDTEAVAIIPIAGVVPHHIPVSVPLLADFYVRLANVRPDIDTFVIFGPDHFEKGRSDVSISESSFETPFGLLFPDTDLIEKIEATNLVLHDEAPFGDHSIHSQLLLIAKLFPHAKIVPITFRSSSTNDYAQLLGERIAELASDKTFFVASVDFSHYLHERQARPIDEQSAEYLRSLDPRMAGLVEADSPQSLVAAISAARAHGATTVQSLGVYNSADFTGRYDYTTGYVLQIIGK